MPLARRASGVYRLLLVAAIALATCPALADPSKAECIAASERGQRARQAGMLLVAREKLSICIAESCPGPVREDCSQLLAELGGVMPTLVLEAKDSAGNDVGARVTMDGVLFAERLDGTAIPVDPGEHRFRFEVEGLPPIERTFILREGSKGRRERVVFGSRVAKLAPGPRAETSSESAKSGSSGAVQRAIGLALEGAGAAGVVLGSVFGILAKVSWDSAHPECQPNCSTQSVQDSHTAESQATLSTVAFALGAALLVGGAFVYFTAPMPGDVAVGPTVSARSTGLDMRGSW
jgi:hypothetical protein